ncbi:MAG: Hsp20/alpha crystallin family protein [Bacilli bacterium]|nr:Hsp20/alpha crystallin family protein [Bacilli bacterium]MDD4298121.1 Hsp20/alpha crystallin family protein [Bacilli bacterium]MDD4643624.1 Hsp20/alpha crystallin family protein [Bacilli bacterium]
MNLVPRYLFNDLFDSFLDIPTSKNNIMKADVYEEDGLYKMDMEIPGFKKEDINIEFDKGYLTISAKKEEVKEDKEYIRRERFYGEYQRSFYVGEIDEKTIKAEFNNGMLQLTFPKSNGKENVKKTIKIQ